MSTVIADTDHVGGGESTPASKTLPAGLPCDLGAAALVFDSLLDLHRHHVGAAATTSGVSGTLSIDLPPLVPRDSAVTFSAAEPATAADINGVDRPEPCAVLVWRPDHPANAADPPSSSLLARLASPLTALWRPAASSRALPSAGGLAIALTFVVAATRDVAPGAASLVAMQDPAAAAALHQSPSPSDDPALVSLHLLDPGSDAALAAPAASPIATGRPVYRVLTFRLPSHDVRSAFLAALASAGVRVPELDAAATAPRPPVLLVVNPFGGVREADRLTRTIIAPLMQLAGVPFERVDTGYLGHAEELARKLEPAAYSAVVAVSGDGVFHEILNGLLSRPDWQDVVDRLPVGMIGA
ncbi:Sphingosine kinase 2, partial [Cladochytrium tenue]